MIDSFFYFTDFSSLSKPGAQITHNASEPQTVRSEI